MTINTGIAQPSEEEILALAKFAISANSGVNFSNLISNIKNSISKRKVIALMNEMTLIGVSLIESRKSLSEQHSKIWIALQHVLVNKLREMVELMKTPAGQRVVKDEVGDVVAHLRFVKDIASSPDSDELSARTYFPWACLVDKDGRLGMINYGWTNFPNALRTMSDLNAATQILAAITEAIINNYAGKYPEPFSATTSTEESTSLSKYVRNDPNLFDAESSIESSDGVGLELSDIDSKYVPK